MIHFIAYGFWYRDFDDMSAEEQSKVTTTMDDLLQVFDASIPEGFNPSLEFMAHMWQPLRVFHKPFLFHVLSESSVIVSHMSLKLLGFQRYSVRGHAYYARGLSAPLLDEEDASEFAASDRVRRHHTSSLTLAFRLETPRWKISPWFLRLRAWLVTALQCRYKPEGENSLNVHCNA